jgi:hypothetical protein
MSELQTGTARSPIKRYRLSVGGYSLRIPVEIGGESEMMSPTNPI